jgi:hypothetical protein
MSSPTKKCRHPTKAGGVCKNNAKSGSDVRGVHERCKVDEDTEIPLPQKITKIKRGAKPKKAGKTKCTKSKKSGKDDICGDQPKNDADAKRAARLEYLDSTIKVHGKTMAGTVVTAEVTPRTKIADLRTTLGEKLNLTEKWTLQITAPTGYGTARILGDGDDDRSVDDLQLADGSVVMLAIRGKRKDVAREVVEPDEQKVDTISVRGRIEREAGKFKEGKIFTVVVSPTTTIAELRNVFTAELKVPKNIKLSIGLETRVIMKKDDDRTLDSLKVANGTKVLLFLYEREV